MAKLIVIGSLLFALIYVAQNTDFTNAIEDARNGMANRHAQAMEIN